MNKGIDGSPEVEEIVNGEEADKPIPWQVSVGYLKKPGDLDTFSHQCGGTILDEHTILSAAHCFGPCQQKWDDWYIRAGSLNTKSGGQVSFSCFL